MNHQNWLGEFGHLIGITNNEESRLGRAANARLTMEAGVESTVSCKAYVATLATLGAMMARGCGIVCEHYATGLRSEDVAADGEPSHQPRLERIHVE